jgi:hypothetical protein
MYASIYKHPWQLLLLFYQQWWLPNFDIPEGLLHLSMDGAVH